MTNKKGSESYSLPFFHFKQLPIVRCNSPSRESQ